MLETLHAGDKAYLDTLQGLIACKVLEIKSNNAFASGTVIPSNNISVKVQITGKNNRYLYRKGEILSTWAIHTIPRKCVRRTKYQTMIRTYMVQL